MLNLDQVLILSDIFAEMDIEKMPLGLSNSQKEIMQCELRNAYTLENILDQEAEIKVIQAKYGADVLPQIVKFVLGNIRKAKQPIKEFIASYKGIEVDEASKLGIKDITKIIFEIKDELKECLESFLSPKSTESKS